MISQIFSIVFPILAIVAAGFLYGRKHLPNMEAGNKITIDVLLPALIFDVLSSTSFDLHEYQSLSLAVCIMVFGSALIAWPVAALAKFQFKTFLPPMMFNNSANMGIPLAVFTFGDNALPAAVVMFVTMNFLHFSVGIRILNPHASLWSMLRIPMIMSTLAGLSFSIMQWHLPELIMTPIKMLGQISIPLMLFALGVRLIDIDWKDWKIGITGAVICPLSGLMISIPAGYLLDLPDLQYSMLILFGALPPAVLNYMLAERYDQQPRRVASIVLLGNFSSVLVIPLVLPFAL